MQISKNSETFGNSSPTPEVTRESLLNLSVEQLADMVLTITKLARKTESENEGHNRRLNELESEKVRANCKADNLTVSLTVLIGAKATRKLLRDLAPIIEHQTETMLEFGVNEKGGLI